MRIAVTGASGFIGRHVIAELQKSDVEIIAVVRNRDYVPTGRNVSVSYVDIYDESCEFPQCIGSPDAVVHLAWGGLPNYRSLHHFEEELPRQYRLLSEMVKNGLKSLVVAGTCFEYGMKSGPLREDLPAEPANPYGYAKNALRSQLEFLRKDVHFNFTWARLFYLFGEGQAPNALYSQLKRAVENGECVFNMSGGEQLRDYLPAEKVAAYLASFAVGSADAGLINIASGSPVSVRALVEGWIRENGWDIELNLGYYPYPDHEPMAFWGDVTKLGYWST
jgi:dTDP-6-deoxy-L-talose 4-dehydrogenase (NAD+)